MKSTDQPTPRFAAALARRANVAAAAAYAALAWPTMALAANETFNAVKDIITSGLSVVGGAMVVFGAVTVGMNVSGAAQGNGGAIGAGIATMVGGAVIAAASVYFGTLSM